MIFKASMDTFTRNMTIMISTLIVGITFVCLFSVDDYKNFTSILFIFTFLFLVLIVLIYKPLRYKINESSIIVDRLFSPVNIMRSNIKEIYKLQDFSTFSAFRLFGVGGFFGYFGLYWNKKYGRMTYYATNGAAAIMIITNDNKKIVITPDNDAAFLEYFLKQNDVLSN